MITEKNCTVTVFIRTTGYWCGCGCLWKAFCSPSVTIVYTAPERNGYEIVPAAVSNASEWLFSFI